MKYVSIDIETTGLNPQKHQILEIGAVIDDTNNPLPFEECPKFHCYIVPEENIVGNAIALQINSNIIELLSAYEKSDDKHRFGIENKMLRMRNASSLFDIWLQQNIHPEKCISHNMRDVSYPSKVQDKERAQNVFCVDSLDGYAITEDDESMVWFKYPKRESSVLVAGKNFASFDKVFLDKCMDIYTRFGHRVLDPVTLYFDPVHDESLPNLKKCLERAGIEKEVSHDALEDAWDVVQVLRHKFHGK